MCKLIKMNCKSISFNLVLLNFRDFIENVGPINSNSKLKTGKGRNLMIIDKNLILFK
jgi:hypothetical protein